MQDADTATVTVTGDHVWILDTFGFGTDASTLGLAPGCWPKLLPTTLGNGRSWRLVRVWPDGAREYRQDMGCLTLYVTNS